MKVQPNPQPCGGGICSPRDIRNYADPVGPKSIGNNGVGLGGSNFGKAGTQGKYTAPSANSSGSAGLGGMNHGNSPSQRG